MLEHGGFRVQGLWFRVQDLGTEHTHSLFIYIHHRSAQPLVHILFTHTHTQTYTHTHTHTHTPQDLRQEAGCSMVHKGALLVLKLNYTKLT